MSWNFIIIGSGFGGSVTACRLAQKGQKVLVLERGRRWPQAAYPIRESWTFDPDEPEKQNGWLDVRLLGKMNVVQGAGIGGGSLVYANVSVEARPELFGEPGGGQISYADLKPYYDRVRRFMNAQPTATASRPSTSALPHKGPVITSAIDFLDGAFKGQKFWIQDGGYPHLLVNCLRHLEERTAQKIADALETALDDNIMLWFSQGLDAGDGRLSLGRHWWRPFGKQHLQLDWNLETNEPLFNAILDMQLTRGRSQGRSAATPHGRSPRSRSAP